MANKTKNNTPRLDTSTWLAYDRTRLAYDRNLLAWVRTATSLITFGFAFYKFFQLDLKGAEHVERLITAREVGLFMITCGLVSLLLGTVQHVLSMRQMRARWPDAPRSVAAVLAALIAILGLTTFIAALFRQ